MSPQLVVTTAVNVLPAAVALSGMPWVLMARGVAGGAVQPSAGGGGGAELALGVDRRGGGGRRGRVATEPGGEEDEPRDDQQHGGDDEPHLPVARSLTLALRRSGVQLLLTATGPARSCSLVTRASLGSGPPAREGHRSLGFAPC